MNELLIILLLLYISVIIGIYIKLLDFRAPKSSIIHAFIIPVATMIMCFKCAKPVLSRYNYNNKLEFFKKLLFYIYTVIKSYSALCGIVCINICKCYDTLRATNKSMSKSTSSNFEFVDFFNFDKDTLSMEVSALFN